MAESGRCKIGVFGRIGCGKSSLIHALAKEKEILIPPSCSSTIESEYRTADIPGIGTCTLIDTAGFDDGELCLVREEKIKLSLHQSDVAVIVFAQEDTRLEEQWIQRLQLLHTPIVAVVNKADTLENGIQICQKLKSDFGLDGLLISCKTLQGVDELFQRIARLYEGK